MPNLTDIKKIDWQAVRLGIGCAPALAMLCAVGCASGPRPVIAVAAGGNYCSAINRVVWTSDANSPAPASGPKVATFNIFISDSAGNNRQRLTNDHLPDYNEHPVSLPHALSQPPGGAVDGHPWVGEDHRIYFVRRADGSNVHKIWRVNADGAGSTELIPGEDRDRIHPNLRNDGDLLLYTAGLPGAPDATEIRIFNQKTKDDKVLYAPGWPVAAAIWHPDGSKAVVAEQQGGSGHYRIVEISYPAGTVLRALTDSAQDNTVPYYSYPAANSIDWVQWAGTGKHRNIALMNADGTNQRLLTNDGFENTKIVGDIELDPAFVTPSNPTGCHPKPIGCDPHPPTCGPIIPPSTPNNGGG